MKEHLETRDGLTLWQSSILWEADNLCHSFSCRKGGVSSGPFAALNLSYKGGDEPQKVMDNRQLFYQALGLSPFQVRVVKQVHGCKVLEARSGLQLDLDRQEADALVTSDHGIALGIKAADCAVLYFYDPDNRAIGLAHAGWRGTALSIGPKVLEKMEELYSTSMHNVKAAISPAIGGCCYQIKEDVVNSFNSLDMLPETALQTKGNNIFLHLKEVNRYQLVKAGVKPECITVSDFCTSCRQDLFFSYRRDGANTGSMMALLALTTEPFSDGFK